MVMRKAIATPPGEPTEYADLTPVEEAARVIEEANAFTPTHLAERSRLETAGKLDRDALLEFLFEKMLEAGFITEADLPLEQLDALAAVKAGKVEDQQ